MLAMMCSILLLPVYSLFKRFRSSHACHMIVFGSVLACVQPVQMLQKLSCLPRVRFCSCLCKVCSNVSDALMHGCHVFGSVLAYAKSAHVFQKLSHSLCGLCLSVLSLLTLPQTVTLFYVSLRSQAPQRQYTVLSFSSMRRHGHSHKPTSSRALRYYTVGIPF